MGAEDSDLQASLDRIAEHVARSAERERAVAAALEGLAGQLNRFTATLAGEVRRAGEETTERAVAELRAAAGLDGHASAGNGSATPVVERADPMPALDRLAGLPELAARTSAGVDRLSEVPLGLSTVAAAVDRLAARPGPPPAASPDDVTALAAVVADLTARVDDLRTHVHALVAAQRQASTAALAQLPPSPTSPDSIPPD